MSCTCGRVDCADCATNPSPFHIAANPKDSARSLARRYRAVFGDRAYRMAAEDEDTAHELGLPVRARLCDAASHVLRQEDHAKGIDSDRQ